VAITRPGWTTATARLGHMRVADEVQGWGLRTERTTHPRQDLETRLAT
jgi:hypothetical protein